MTINTDLRPLTLEEFKTCWVALPDNVEKERMMGKTLQISEILPVKAKDGTTSVFPSSRTSYDLSPLDALVERQTMRSFKLSFLPLQSLKEWLKEDRTDLPDFEDRFDKSIDFKEKGNTLFRQGKYMQSLVLYVQAWGSLLPYHIFAFTQSDQRVLNYGNLESTIFNYMMAALVEWSETDKTLNLQSKYAILGLALSCGQIDTEPVTAATLDVRTMYKASKS
ncbi:uncharacterized protein L201_005260 [Kwoniella dendrophila CBS 6074]|uniref:Nitroreductase domain-containing protein n=1 Tax=Kwoniella dendrophila CBS 6074 TaxID=1295534 RepID=A0AAX4K073_9TREE